MTGLRVRPLARDIAILDGVIGENQHCMSDVAVEALIAVITYAEQAHRERIKREVEARAKRFERAWMNPFSPENLPPSEAEKIRLPLKIWGCREF